MERHAFAQYVEQAGALSQRQRAALAAVLQRAGGPSVAGLIDTARGPVPACPHCGAHRLHRHGHAGGLQRYRCAYCRRTCNALTGTPLARLRKRGKWLIFLDCMLASRTVRAAAALTGVHRNTSFRWRHRFLAGARLDRDLPLHGIVEADETYLLESQKGSRRLDRPPRRRGGRARQRGISHEHVCILVARDRAGRTADVVTGRAPLRCAQLAACLPHVLGPDCLLVSDGHPAYRAFARSCGVAHEALNLRAGVRSRDSRRGALHVQNVNGYHGRFKRWLLRFHGVASRYLSNYLGWRWALDHDRIGSPEMLLMATLQALFRTARPPPHIER